MSGELREALTAAQVTALIQKRIDPLLLEYQRRYAPLVRATPSIPWNSTDYYFSQRTQRAAGGFVTDGGARSVTNSTYAQNSFKIRLLQNVGAVTGFSQAVSADLIGDLREREIDGAVQGLLWDIEAGMLWGNDGATNQGPYPQFSGYDTLVSSTTGAATNTIDRAGNTFALADLDKLIDMVEQNASMPIGSNYMLVASTTTVSKTAQLMTAQQRFVDKVEVETGLNVLTYRDVPLIKTSFLGTRSLQMGTVTTSTASGVTGATLADSTTYRYQIVPVMARSGEMAASTEVSRTTGSAGTNLNTITLSFSTPAGLDAAGPVLYKVYRSTAGGASGTVTLLGVVDATVVLGADGITPTLTTSIVDNGTSLVPMNSSTAPSVPPTAYVGTNTGLFPTAAGQENIYLVPRDRDFLVRPYIRELRPLDVYPTTAAPDTLPFAIVSDTTLAIRAPKYVGRLSRVQVAL